VHASQSFFNIDRPLYLRPGDSQLLTSAANFDGLIVPGPDTCSRSFTVSMKVPVSVSVGGQN